MKIPVAGKKKRKDSGIRYLGDNFFYCRYWVVFVFHNLVLVSRVQANPDLFASTETTLEFTLFVSCVSLAKCPSPSFLAYLLLQLVTFRGRAPVGSIFINLFPHALSTTHTQHHLAGQSSKQHSPGAS